MNYRSSVILFSAVVSFLFSLPAGADSLEELQKQVAEMRRISDAQAANLANAVNQIQEVLSEFQKVHGQVDLSLHGNDEQDKLIKDNQLRLNILEDKIQLLAAQLEEIKAVGLLPPEQAKNLTEFRLYQKGLSKINASKFREAVADFKSFISAHPKSLYAENAQYWIGESFFAMRDFTAAVVEFQNVVKKYPKGRKVPPSLLKQGLSFYEMQSFDDAKAFFSKLITRFPGTEEAVRAEEQVQNINKILEIRAREAVEKKSL